MPEIRPRCKACSSNDTRLSGEKSILDPILALLGRKAYRCRNCKSRFYVTEKPARKKSSPQSETILMK